MEHVIKGSQHYYLFDVGDISTNDKLSESYNRHLKEKHDRFWSIKLGFKWAFEHSKNVDDPATLKSHPDFDKNGGLLMLSFYEEALRRCDLVDKKVQFLEYEMKTRGLL